MVSNSPGQKYKESGKVEPVRFIIATLMSMLLCGLLGIAYGALSHINPLIYINFLILAGAIIGCIVITMGAIRLSKTRNRMVSTLLIVLSALFLIYCAWGATISLETYRYGIWDALFLRVDISDILSYAGVQQMSVGRFGRSGLPISSEFMGLFYVIELLALIIIPLVVLLKDHFYFCEKCQLPYDELQLHYTRRNHKIFSRIDTGSLEELKEEELIGSEAHVKALAPQTRLSKLALHRCPGCGDVLVDATMGTTKKDDKNLSEFKRDSEIEKITGVYLDQASADMFFNRAGATQSSE